MKAQSTNHQKRKRKRQTCFLLLSTTTVTIILGALIAPITPHLLMKTPQRQTQNHPKMTKNEHKVETERIEKQFQDRYGYLFSKWFSVDSTKTDSHIFIDLQIPDIDIMFKPARKDYMRSLVKKNRRNLVRIEPLNSRLYLERIMTYQADNDEQSFAQSVIPVKVNALVSHEGFEARVGTKTDLDHRRRNRRVLRSTSRTVRRYLDETNSHVVFFPANWVTPVDIAGIFSIVGFILRVIVVIIQTMLSVVRPCITRKGTHLYNWSISFTSSLLSIQFILISGVLAENYGGPLNSAFQKMLVQSRTRFFEYFNIHLMAQIDGAFEKVGFWKLSKAGYIASPIFDNYIGLFLLTLAIFACAVGTPVGSDSNSVAKKMRIGTSVSFMMPLVLNSVNCLFAVFWGGSYDISGLLSAGVSIAVLVYYFMFLIEMVGSYQKSSYFKSSYDHMNFDLPSFYVTNVVKNYEFVCMWVLTMISVFLSDYCSYGVLGVCLVYIVMAICNGMVEIKKMQRKKYLWLARIRYMKTANFVLRAAIFGSLFAFSMVRRSISTLGIKAFTLIAFIGLIIDAVMNAVIFYLRFDGMRRLWDQTIPNYVPNQGTYRTGGRELDEKDLPMNAEEREQLYAKYGGGAYE